MEIVCAVLDHDISLKEKIINKNTSKKSGLNLAEGGRKATIDIYCSYRLVTYSIKHLPFTNYEKRHWVVR